MTAEAPLPAHPVLAQVAAGLESVGALAEVWDADWRLAYLTRDYLLSAGAGRVPDGALGIGEHLVAAGTVDARLGWPAGPTLESLRRSLIAWGGMLTASQSDKDRLLELCDPRLRDVVVALQPRPMPALWTDRIDVRFGKSAHVRYDGVWIRVLDDDARYTGAVAIGQPAVGGAVLGMLALGDRRLFSRLLDLIQPQRRSIAILFADLEGSTALSRTLSASDYFVLIRRLTRAIDAEVVDRDGVVGKHVGDGVTAFFLVDEESGESAAAAAALAAVPAIRAAAVRVAQTSALPESALVLRFGLHWGATVQVGRLITAGRLEATAIGDEVNEAARIEACATGGRALASKALMERVSPADARGLGLDPAALRYTLLGDLPTATEKARRDAPAIPVCELQLSDA
jgi:class 3 adenylate cyclase